MTNTVETRGRGRRLTEVLRVWQREQSRQETAELERLQEQREELAATEERRRIAREIHDGVAQTIYMLAVNLEQVAGAADDDAVGCRLRALVCLAKQSLLEVRHYIFDLEPVPSGGATLTDAVTNQVREFGAISGLRAHLDIAGDEPNLPFSHVRAAYRIVQEALANVLRHAQAEHVHVRLEFSAESIEITIEDDGIGFALAEASETYGLRNMRERAEDLSGWLEMKGGPGRGTHVAAVLPLPPAAPDS